MTRILLLYEPDFDLAGQSIPEMGDGDIAVYTIEGFVGRWAKAYPNISDISDIPNVPYPVIDQSLRLFSNDAIVASLRASYKRMHYVASSVQYRILCSSLQALIEHK